MSRYGFTLANWQVARSSPSSGSYHHPRATQVSLSGVSGRSTEATRRICFLHLDQDQEGRKDGRQELHARKGNPSSTSFDKEHAKSPSVLKRVSEVDAQSERTKRSKQQHDHGGHADSHRHLRHTPNILSSSGDNTTSASAAQFSTQVSRVNAPRNLPMRLSHAAQSNSLLGQILRASQIRPLIDDEEDLYGATPRPERRSTVQDSSNLRDQSPNVSRASQGQIPPDPFVQQEQREQQQGHQLINEFLSGTIESARPESEASTPPASNTGTVIPHDLQPPSFSLRFRLWLTVSNHPNRNVMFLDNSMSVQRVYERIREKLSRKLEGREIASVSFTLPDEEAIDVEIDDEEAWETVLEMVKEARLTAVNGTVLRRD